MASQEIEALSQALARLAGPRPALGAARGAVPDEEARDRAPAAARARSRKSPTSSRPARSAAMSTRPTRAASARTRERDDKMLCVVEEVSDLWALDRSRLFPGRYHVLGGRLSALEGVRPEDLGIDQLVKPRVGGRNRRGRAGDERDPRGPDHGPLSRRAAGSISHPPQPVGARPSGRRRARLSRRGHARPGLAAATAARTDSDCLNPPRL